MRTSAGLALSTAAVIGAVLAPAAASAAHGSPAPAAASAPAAAGNAAPGNAPAGSDPSTIVTFAVTTGALTINVPPTAFLGSGLPGQLIDGLLGAVTVTDNRALLNASWNATVSSTSFVTGGGSGNETIPAADVTYDPGTVTTTGTITITTNAVTLSAASQTIVTASAGAGNNTARWNPTIAVAVPVSAVGGTYTGTISHSVA